MSDPSDLDSEEYVDSDLKEGWGICFIRVVLRGRCGYFRKNGYGSFHKGVSCGVESSGGTDDDEPKRPPDSFFLTFLQSLCSSLNFWIKN